MCGIAGLVTTENNAHLLAKLPEMTSLMRHRGPDDEGAVYIVPSSGKSVIHAGNDTLPFDPALCTSIPFLPSSDETPDKSPIPKGSTVGLGHRRLSILDLSPTGHQPMCDPQEKDWIIFNGEIYNYQEVRDELLKTGVQFRGTSDTEVFLYAYKTWGADCQKRFNGMWAAAIWDADKKLLWISHDRFGVKPLHIWHGPGFFAFASEAKAFLPLGMPKPDLAECAAYLADGPCESTTNTLFENVKRFPVGHSAYLDPAHPEQLKYECYFELPMPNLSDEYIESKMQEYAEEYRRILADAVRLRLHADVKVSCALSGGLDSSSITALACLARKEQNSSEAVVTVSNCYSNPDYAGCDESGFIRLVRDHFNIQALTTEPDDSQLDQNHDRCVWCYESGLPDTLQASTSTFRLCHENGIKVNLDGQGADEQLAGYDRYWMDYFATAPLTSRDYWVSFMRHKSPWREKLSWRFSVPLTRSASPYPWRGCVENKIPAHYRDTRIMSKGDGRRPVNESLHNNMQFALQNMLRTVDMSSMMHSIESRQPFMDYRLILFLNTVPYRYKLHAGWTKYIARLGVKDDLPAQIVWRKDKMGWPNPCHAWVAGEFGDLMHKRILASDFLRENFPALQTEVETLRKHTRLFFRAYNLSRHVELFYNNAALGPIS